MIKKRLLAASIVVAMLFTSLPIKAMASNTVGSDDKTQIQQDLSDRLSSSGKKFTGSGENSGPLDFAPSTKDESKKEKEPRIEEADFKKASDMKINENHDPDEKVNIIVELEKDSLLDAGYSTSQIAEGARAKLHAYSQQNKIRTMEAKIEDEIDNDLDILYEYKIAITGMAVSTEYKNLKSIKDIPGVKNAWVSPVYYLSDAEPFTSNASSMIGANKVWNETGYTGQGMKIAIIDTGIYLNHDSFKALSNDKLTDDSMNSEDVSENWNNLNASKYTPRPIGVYRNTKIPYAYNYFGHNLDVAHTGSDHGTHVAGIAAANKIDTTDVVGIAPDAQLAVMQVFAPAGGADFSDVLAAMEDAVYLDVDVMNLSLGSTAGFTDSDLATNAVFDKFSHTDIQVAIASGNDTHNAYNNLYGNNMSLAKNPDIGLVGNPGSYTDSMTVASIDNNAVKTFAITVDGKNIAYNDTATTNYTNFLNQLGTNKQYDYVWLGENVYGGNVTDFKNANNGSGVEGKIALVSRGGAVSFTDKQKNAKDAGAIGCIIYNNTPGILNMQVNDGKDYIPCVSISQNDGKYMIDKLSGGNGKLTTSNGEQQTIINDSMNMSDFSSWGVTPSLKLKPDITGVGGNIYSTRDNNTYGLMSGTSMATPQVAGATAIVMEYVKEKLADGLTEEQIRNITSALLMSTANPVAVEGMEYSPRWQGAGLINLQDVVSTKAYLTSNEQADGRPKAELGDSSNGEYKFGFKINNITDKPLSYELNSSLLTENTATDGKNVFMTSSPVKLESKISFEYDEALKYDFNDDGIINTADARILLAKFNGEEVISKRPDEFMDVNGDGKFDKDDSKELIEYAAELAVSFDDEEIALVVPANGKLDCSASVELTDEDKEYMNTHFENGIYVDGYVYAKSLNDDIGELSMPVMGFYGDWTDASAFDEGVSHYWDSEGEASLFPISIYTKLFMLGVNPYVKAPYDEKHSVVSLKNGLEEIDMGMLRNAKELTFMVTDDKTGEEYWSYTEHDVSKSYYSSTYGMIVPYFIYNPQQGEPILWDGNDKDGNPVADNTKVKFKVQAKLDYEGENQVQSFEQPIWIDNTDPVINNINDLKPEIKDGKVELKLSLKDNNYIAAVIFESLDGAIMAKHNIEGYEPGKEKEYTFDISGFGEDFNIIVADYACNEYVQEVNLDLGEGWDENSLPLTKLDKEKIYAFESTEDGEMSKGWYSASKIDLSGAKNITYANSESYYSAEYIDGYIYAQNTAGELVVIPPRNTYWKENVLNKQSDIILYDMAFDYSTKTLYGVGWDYSIGGSGASILATVDIASGSITRVSALSGMSTDTMVTLGCTTEGQLYGIDMGGILYEIPKEYENGKTIKIGVTDFAKGSNFFGVNTIQSMAYDHNTDTMYWNAFSNKYDINTNQTLKSYGVYKVNLKTGESTLVGDIRNNCGIGLFIPYDGGDILPDIVKPTGVSIADNLSTINMLPTQTKKISLAWEPWNAVQSPVDWTIKDSNPVQEGAEVAKIDNRGKVTAISEGTATVEAKTMVYPDWEPDGYEVTLSVTIKVLASTDEMYGFLLSDLNNMEKSKNTWITFKDSSPEKYESITKAYEGEVFAGAYYNGYVYIVCPGTSGADLYKSKVTKASPDEKASFGDLEFIGTMPETNITDMTFDYTTGRMYVIENKQSFMYLSIIDIETASLDRVSTIDDVIVGLACDEKGTLYGLNGEGKLFTFDSETGEGTFVYDTGVTTGGFIQSMTYDHNSGNLYWAQCMGYNSSAFYLLANTTNEDEMGTWSEWQTVKLGDIGGRKGAEISGLFTIPKDEPKATYIPVTGISMDQNDFTIMEGSKANLSATTTPKRPTVQSKVWTSSDEDVAKVDEFGVVTAINSGKTTVAVSIKDRESGMTYDDSIEITVIESSGDLKAFLRLDNRSSYYDWWVSIPDYKPSEYKPIKRAAEILRLVAGDYYDGYIYGYNKEGTLYRVEADSYSYSEIGKHSINDYNFAITDMTYDYDNFRMLALSSGYSSTLKPAIYSVDLGTGELTKLVDTQEPVYGLAYGNGKYYTVKGNGMICTVDLETGNLTEFLDTGAKVEKYLYGYDTTLAYDHNNDRLYMAPIENNDPYVAGELTMIDIKGKVSMSLGKIGQNGSFVCAMYVEPKEGSVPEDKSVRNVLLDRENIRLKVGENTTIVPKVLPTTAENKDVTWSTSNENVAKVNNGVVTAVGLGTADITVTTSEGGYTSSCKVTVIDESKTSGDTAYAFSKEHGGLIKFNPDLPESTIKLLTSYNNIDKVLGSTFVDGALYYLVDVENYYPKLYKMDINSYIPQEVGYVAMQVGPANDMTYDPFSELIYITSGFYIYAVDPMTGDVINSVNINNNDTHGVTATNGYIYLVASDGTGAGTLYSIDPERILTANNGEVLTPLGDYTKVGALTPDIHTSKDSKVEVNFANRTAYVTADDKLYSLDLMNGNVNEIDSIPPIGGLAFITPKDFKPVIYVTGVSLDKKSMNLRSGMTKQLKATVYPDKDKVNKEVTWSSNDSSIVKVDDNGSITAVAPGTTVVTVTTKEGGFTASCTVTVVAQGNENWMYGYSVDEKAFMLFDVNRPDVEGEKVLDYDAGMTSYGEQIYPRGTEYLDGYVYFAHSTSKYTWNLYRWNMKDNSVEEFMTDLKNEYGYSMTIADMAVIGKELYIMGPTGLYVVNTETKTLEKAIAENSWSAPAITAVGDNTIIGQMGNGRQIIYTKTEEGWTASRPNKYNNLIFEDEDYYLSSAVTLNDVMYICSGRKLYTLDYIGYNASKVGDIGTGKLSSIFVVPSKNN